MKTLISTLALALTLGTVSLANSVVPTANPDGKARSVAYKSVAYQSVVYPSQTAPVVHVVVEKEQGGRIDVRFKSKTGAILAEQSIGKAAEKVAMKFRVDELPDGIYTIEVSNGSDRTTQQIKLGTKVQETPRTIAMQ
jgi:hypothetical protein